MGNQQRTESELRAIGAQINTFGVKQLKWEEMSNLGRSKHTGQLLNGDLNEILNRLLG